MFHFIKLIFVVIILGLLWSVAHEMSEEIKNGPPVADKIGPQTPASFDDHLPTKLYKDEDYKNCSILATLADKC